MEKMYPSRGLLVKVVVLARSARSSRAQNGEIPPRRLVVKIEVVEIERHLRRMTQGKECRETDEGVTHGAAARG